MYNPLFSVGKQKWNVLKSTQGSARGGWSFVVFFVESHSHDLLFTIKYFEFTIVCNSVDMVV